MNLMVLCFLIVFVCIADKIMLKITSKNMKVSRKIQGKNRIYKGDCFQIKTTFENRKKFPISLAYVTEECPQGLCYILKKADDTVFKSDISVSKYGLNAYERRSRLVTIKAYERGRYTFSSINTMIGDVLGIYNTKVHDTDYIEVIVYPKIKKISDYEFKSRSSFGEISIKNWIYNDNFLIKGIRDYTINDRMKDVHWKASARMGKLMVKEMECATDRSLMLYLSLGNKGEYDCNLDNNDFEKALEICAGIIEQCNIEGVSVGMGTNSNVIKGDNIKKFEISPTQGNRDKLLELCSSIYFSLRCDFLWYLKENMNNFRRDTTYMFMCKRLNSEEIALLSFLADRGIIVYVMDIGCNNKIPCIDGVEIIKYRGEKDA